MTTRTATAQDHGVVVTTAPGLFSGYELGAAYDEMIDAAGGPRPHYRPLFDRLATTPPDDFRRRKAMTDLSMRQDGVGFTVYRPRRASSGCGRWIRCRASSRRRSGGRSRPA